MTEGRLALGGLALFFLWLFVALPALYGQSQQTPQINAEQNSDTALKGQEHAKAGEPKAAKPNEEHGGKNTEQREDDGTEFWPTFLGLRLKITDSLLAIFTGGLLIFTGLLWRSTDKLWIAGEKQLKLAREALVSDQRAWLIVTDFRIEKLHVGEVVKGAADISAQIFVTIRNVGRTPALNVDVQLKMLGNYPTFADSIKEHAAKYSTVGFEGHMVAAGESTETDYYEGVSGSELYRYGERGSMGIRPLIVGCITYQILQDSQYRQTAFGYWLSGPGGGTLNIEDGDLSVNDIEANATSGGFAN